jgi:hypothetical protein
MICNFGIIDTCIHTWAVFQLRVDIDRLVKDSKAKSLITADQLQLMRVIATMVRFFKVTARLLLDILPSQG